MANPRLSYTVTPEKQANMNFRKSIHDENKALNIALNIAPTTTVMMD